MIHSTIYELPLNERMRTFLRLEFLFQQALFSIQGMSTCDSRNTINAIIDIVNIMSRVDLRMELIKELERQTNALLTLSSQDGVDPSILEDTLSNLTHLTENLKAPQNTSPENLRNNNLLKLILQRNAIPGGNCNFDIPLYHFWLKQEAEQRIEILQSWFKQLDDYRLAIDVILRLLRESSVNSPIIAKQGFYQQSLDSKTAFQLVRVLLLDNVNYFAEISGGKHRFSVRFMEPTINERPIPCTTDIEFQLSCCVL